mgnify:CR=1 FL=1
MRADGHWRDAVKALVTESLRLSGLLAGDPQLRGASPEKLARVAASLDLVASLRLPSRHRAGHVLAGLQAQGDATCDALAAALRREGVTPAPGAGARALWLDVAAEARRRAETAREAGDEAAAWQFFKIASTYGAGTSNLRARGDAVR